VELFVLAKKLVSIESTTGHEGPAAFFLRDYLSELGFNVSLDEVSGGRFNVFAFVDEPRAVFSTHLDTVAPVIRVAEDDVCIYGRGACDSKGILAAMVAAAESLVREGVRNVGLLFVVGEERGSDGAMKADTLKNGCRFLVNGEPTENKLALGSKGAVRFEIQTSGKSAHSAYPELGENAIDKLLDILQDVRSCSFPVHAVLGETTVNIGTIRGGTLANVVPDRASAELIVRSVTGVESVKETVRGILGGRGEVVYRFQCDPVLLDPLNGFETAVAAFTTDIPLLTHWGKPFLLGPGSILDAHTDHERISKKQLEEAVPLYVRLVKQLLNRKEPTA
jgi:acetylornithine deacetylase